MSCTTILVGKKASYDGSTIIARDDDSGSGRYDPKKFVAIAPKEQPRHYRSVLSHVEIDLPDNPCRYSIVPNVLPNRGILAEAGVSECNVAMSATETIAVNERVLGADPLVVLQPADEIAGKPEIPGGIGEKDIITLVLPYVNTAREGVKRLAELLETYGTYESNGIIISDVDEIWYVETIGGHHWIARRVPDDKCAIIPNQLGIDYFDFDDAFGDAREFMCSDDLQEFIETHHLGRASGVQVGMNGGHCNPRIVFGTATAKDHIYNTPRAWYMYRYLDLDDAGKSHARIGRYSVVRRAGERGDHRRRRLPAGVAFRGHPVRPVWHAGNLGKPPSLPSDRHQPHRTHGRHADSPVRACGKPLDHVDLLRFRRVHYGGAVLCKRGRYARLSARHHAGGLHGLPVLDEPSDRGAR